MRRNCWAIVCGLAALWMVGCDKPCATSGDCGADGMCVASRCEQLSCDRTIFAIDPATGVCTPLSGCFLTTDQLTWQSCADDPCVGQGETACVGDARCQPVYANPNVSANRGGDSPSTVPVSQRGCGDVSGPPIDANGQAVAPGVNNGETPKHPPTAGSGCSSVDGSARSYSGCRAVAQVAPQRPCEELATTECGTRRDCTTSAGMGGDFRDSPTPTVPPQGPDTAGNVPRAPSLGQCFPRFDRPTTSCQFASGGSCLLSATCQPVGTRCYCPPGGKCDCEGGTFLGCESNDRLRRCSSSAECGADERCDNDEACIAPRTFAAVPTGPAPVPGTASCLGACVPKGCAGLGENRCNTDPSCDGGSYGTVCHPAPYCRGGDVILDDADPRRGTELASSSACGCGHEYQGCAPVGPVADLRIDRSLLIRDPAIVDDPALRLDAVLGKLAPAGKVDEFVGRFVTQIGADKTLASGAKSQKRTGYSQFLVTLQPDQPGVAARFAGLVHTTALVNRVDLRQAGSCGEARITFALTSAYADGNRRMTIIVELRVPDDGQGCRQVAQRWAELSLVDSVEERRARLLALYGELLTPQTLGQIRTNEFLNRTGREPWELREFHLGGDGMLELAPVAQTIDARLSGSADLLRFLQTNSVALQAGNVVIPTAFLAASSTEDGGRLAVAGRGTVTSALEKALNEQSCAGCHLTETQSPFVHIGERMGKFVGGSVGYQPVGRAVIDEFLQKELVTRAKGMRQLLSGAPQGLLPMARTGRARVH